MVSLETYHPVLLSNSPFGLLVYFMGVFVFGKIQDTLVIKRKLMFEKFYLTMRTSEQMLPDVNTSRVESWEVLQRHKWWHFLYAVLQTKVIKICNTLSNPIPEYRISKIPLQPS